MDSGQVQIDPAGYFTLPRIRPKVPVGRYALFSKSGAGVSLNLEYIIQAGATIELVREYGWSSDALDFERGEFDAIAYGPEDRIILVMEA